MTRMFVFAVSAAALLSATLPAQAWGLHRAITLPAVSASIREILDAASRERGKDVWPLITFAPNSDVEPMFGRWRKSGMNCLTSWSMC